MLPKTVMLPRIWTLSRLAIKSEYLPSKPATINAQFAPINSFSYGDERSNKPQDPLLDGRGIWVTLGEVARDAPKPPDDDRQNCQPVGMGYAQHVCASHF